MSDKTFRNILIAVMIVGMIATAFTVGYTVYLRENCSIIAYIANER